MILAMYYKPDPDKAYASIQYITNDLTLGWLVRGMHRWGASVFIILMFLHMGRVFLFGAYKYPRELNWIVGAVLLDHRDARGLHRLPAAVGPDRVLGDGRRDQHQRDARRSSGRSSRSSSAAAPRSDADTLSPLLRAPHAAAYPGALFALIGLHLYLVVRLGVTSPPWSKRRGRARSHGRPAEGPRGPAPGAAAMSSVDEKHAAFQRYKEDVQTRGEAVLPLRDVPRHGDEPRRRGRDHRARLRLVLHRRTRTTTRASSARCTPTRPTRGRRTSSRGRTGTSTSSSTCSGSSSGRSR